MTKRRSKDPHQRRPGEAAPGEPEPDDQGAGEAEDPFRRMMDLWTQGTKAYIEASQTFLRATGEVARRVRDEAGSAGDDPRSELRETAERWGRTFGQLPALEPQFLASLLDELPRSTKERLDAGTFSQLERLARDRWDGEVERLSEAGLDLGDRLAAADPARLAALMESMAEEYLADLEAIKGSSLELKIEPLAEAWRKVASGEDDDGARRTIDRLLRAMATKAELGPEYYADPETTEVGQTPRELVHRVGKTKLFRYLPPEDGPQRRGDPVLLVYSVINKPYILDLVPGFSFIEHLLGRGLDVSLIEWGETEPGDRETTLDSYIDPGLAECVRHIKERTGARRVSLFGHCIGGNLALLYAAQHPGEVSRLVTLTTPVTAAKGGVVALWTDRDLLPIDTIIETYGHMPAKLIRYSFVAIKPYAEVLKWKMFLENVADDRVMSLFYPVDRWANENVDIPGEAFRKFIVEVFHRDRFRRGRTRINGRRANLKAITSPLLNLAASKDWIVPPDSAAPLNDLVSSRVSRFTLIDGAHVSIMIDPRARAHWTEMSDFLLEDFRPKRRRRRRRRPKKRES